MTPFHEGTQGFIFGTCHLTPGQLLGEFPWRFAETGWIFDDSPGWIFDDSVVLSGCGFHD